MTLRSARTESFRPNNATGTGVSLASRISGVAFLALFPMFYFYHFGISTGVFPAFLAGWHGPMTAIFVLPLLVSLLVVMRARRLALFGDPVTGAAVVFLIYASGWMIVNLVVVPWHPAHEELATALLALTVYFCVGAMLVTHWRLLRASIMGCWAIMLALAVGFVSDNMLMTAVETETGDTIYQGLARSMMLVSMFATATRNNILVRLSVGILSIIALFVLGARSELYGFLFAYGLLEFFVNRRSTLGLALMAAASLAMLIVIMNYFDVLGASRQMQVFDLEAARSWRARQYFELLAWDQILSSPVWGVYGGHWEFFEGGYAHNALSAWVSLGLLGFLLYVGLTLFAAWRSFRAIASNPDSALARFAFLVSIAALLLIVVAKPVFWAVTGLAWGLNTRAVLKARPVTRPAMQR